MTLQDFISIRHIAAIWSLLAVGAESLGATLAEEAKSPGVVEPLESTASDPVGIAGLPGLIGSFVVEASCEDAFGVVSDIEKYPERVEKVKEVVVLERDPQGLVVRYTEGAMGISSTTKMRWTFEKTPSYSVSSIVVGKGESPSYTMLRFEKTQDPKYCRLNATVFADVSWLPRFAVSWVMDATRDELASAIGR